MGNPNHDQRGRFSSGDSSGSDKSGARKPDVYDRIAAQARDRAAHPEKYKAPAGSTPLSAGAEVKVAIAADKGGVGLDTLRDLGRRANAAAIGDHQNAIEPRPVPRASVAPHAGVKSVGTHPAESSGGGGIGAGNPRGPTMEIPKHGPKHAQGPEILGEQASPGRLSSTAQERVALGRDVDRRSYALNVPSDVQLLAQRVGKRHARG